MSWTDERIERLRELWTRGMTASHIADELGGVSRNAVIGKAHRLGLQSRPSPVKANELGGDEPNAAAEPAPAAQAPRAAPIPQPTAPVSAPSAAAAPAAPAADAEPAAPAAPVAPQPLIRSIGPGGFLRQA
ncbi:MAG: GcrA cell cycle regulator, partial [Alphaproteobacteria bacterium]|nr:GcrA cell cycle regulator [Alphaproteobacteria bacterium]